jgi:hypothetical protein
MADSPNLRAALRHAAMALAAIAADAPEDSPLKPKPDLHGVPRFPDARARISEATSKDRYLGRVR